jgi:hypothetical protein
MIPLDSLSRSSRFVLVMRRDDGSLYPCEFKFRKLNKKANSCEWSRAWTSVQDVHRTSSLDYISEKAFATVAEAHEEISRINHERE